MVGAVGWANKQLPITDDMQPAVLRNLIVQCFKEPQERPSFSDIIGILKPLLDVKHLHPTPPLPATAEAAPAAAGTQAPTGATPLQEPQQQASAAPAASPFGGQEQQDWVPTVGHPRRQPGAGAAQAASPAQGPVPAAAASPFGGQEQQDWVPPRAQGPQMPGFQPPPTPASPFGSREQQEQEGPRTSPAPPASLSGDSQQQQRPSPAVSLPSGDSQQHQQRAPSAAASPFTGGVRQDAISDAAAAAQKTPVRQWAASPFADEAQQDRLPPPGTQRGGAVSRHQHQRTLPGLAPTAGAPHPPPLGSVSGMFGILLTCSAAATAYLLLLLLSCI